MAIERQTFKSENPPAGHQGYLLYCRLAWHAVPCLNVHKPLWGEAVETAATTYDWLNRILAVGIGHRRPDGPVYSVFEVL